MIVVTIRRAGAETDGFSLDRPEAIFGKSAGCDVVLQDPKVSRRHARISVEDGKLFLEDLGSTNGTTVGGRPVEGRMRLRQGEEIAIGPFTVLASLAAAAAEAPEATPATVITTIPAPASAPAVAAPPPAAPPTDGSYGPLASLFADESVSEVMVNGPGEIYIERDGRVELTSLRFTSEEALREMILAIAAQVGRRVDSRRPMLDARLADGSRVNAVFPPLALRGPYLTIRRFPHERLSPRQLVELGALSPPMLDFLAVAVAGRLNLLVSGGTGSGKTTLLNALCSFLGADERVVTIEDAAELRLPQRHVLPLETRPPDADGEGEVTTRDLVRNALRMRPDRIVVGEVRGGEALDMLQAMNTGHEGSLGTIHANSPREALSRLETLVLFAGTDLPPRAIREQTVTAIRLIVHTRRMRDGGRRVSAITELTGLEGDQFTTGEVFRSEESEKAGAVFRATGYVPRCRDLLIERGQKVDNGWFRS